MGGGESSVFIDFRWSTKSRSFNFGGLADWTFQELEVKQIGHFKCWMSSRLGISCIGGKADWTFQVLDV